MTVAIYLTLGPYSVQQYELQPVTNTLSLDIELKTFMIFDRLQFTRDSSHITA